MLMQKKSKKWGSLQELYTHQCMIVLKHRYLYYILHKSIITDSAYDKLEKDLKQFEIKHPLLVHDNSPTQSVGSNKLKNYPQSIRMLYKEGKIKNV